MKKISLYIDEQLWHRFRIECVTRKTSASQEVAGLLAQQLQQWQLADEQRAAPSGEGCSKDRKSTRLNSSHIQKSRMPSSA